MHIIHAFLRFTSLSIGQVRQWVSQPPSSCSHPTTTTMDSSRPGPAAADPTAAAPADDERTPLLLASTTRAQILASQWRRQSLHSLTGEYQDFSHSSHAVALFFFHALTYYTAAYLGLSCWSEHWPLDQTLYFATVVFTTVGFGDVSPQTPAGKFVTLLLALYGVVMLGLFLGVLGEALVQAQSQALQQRQRGLSHILVQSLGPSSSSQNNNKNNNNNNNNAGSNNNNNNNSHQQQDEKEEALHHHHHHDDDDRPTTATAPVIETTTPLWREILHILLLEFPLAFMVWLLAWAIGRVEGWTLFESTYWAVITGTTIGLGDVAPRTPAMRMASVLFIPLAVAVLGEVLARIASAYLDRKRRRTEQEFLHRTLTLCDLETMDTDRDGLVTPYEFLTHMLVKLQKVQKEDVDMIRTLFDQLDQTHSGTLTKEDLQSHLHKSLPGSIRKTAAAAAAAPHSSNQLGWSLTRGAARDGRAAPPSTPGLPGTAEV